MFQYILLQALNISCDFSLVKEKRKPRRQSRRQARVEDWPKPGAGKATCLHSYSAPIYFPLSQTHPWSWGLTWLNTGNILPSRINPSGLAPAFNSLLSPCLSLPHSSALHFQFSEPFTHKFQQLSKQFRHFLSTLCARCWEEQMNENLCCCPNTLQQNSLPSFSLGEISNPEGRT